VRPPCSQKDIDAIAAVRDEFLKNKPPSLPHYRDKNLIDEAPLFSKDVEFNSTDHTLVAHFGDPPKFIFKNYLAQLIVSVSLPESMTLENPEHVQNAIYKLYMRVKYYQNL
jgi:hypothetical protein